MSRRHHTSRSAVRARMAAREARALQLYVARQEAEALREQKAAQREADREAKAEARENRLSEREAAKEAARLDLERRNEEAAEIARAAQERVTAIENLLANALDKRPAVNLDARIKRFSSIPFDERPWPNVPPDRSAFEPPKPSFLSKIMPASAARYERSQREAQSRYEAAESEYQQRRRNRTATLAAFRHNEQLRQARIEKENAEVRDLKRGPAAGEHEHVLAYYAMVFAQNLVEEADAIAAEIRYSPESRHLVVDQELPEMSVIPEIIGAKFVKSADRIDTIERPLAKRKAMYSSLICQVALKGVDTVYRAVPQGVVDCLTINGMLDTIDPGTGQDLRVCLVTVRVTADDFTKLNLRQVQRSSVSGS